MSTRKPWNGLGLTVCATHSLGFIIIIGVLNTLKNEINNLKKTILILEPFLPHIYLL